MNLKHVIGLAAIVLGGMTSCSNILEEDGVSNVITKGETGTLQINLVADGSLNVTTKSEVDLTKDYSSLLNNFKVTLANINNTELPEGTELPNNKSYSEVKEKLYKLKKGTICQLSANYGTMDKVFGWDCPIFQGSSAEITVIANAPNNIEASCTLQNSLVNINISDLTNNNNVTITSIDGISESETFHIYGSNNTSGCEISRNKLYVQANKVAKLVMTGRFTPEGGNGVDFTTPEVQLASSGETTTTAKKRYDVTYTLNSDNGHLKIVVSIDGKVDTVDVPVIVDPYNPTPSQE